MADWQRTHTCGELRDTHIGQTVTLNGWVNVTREYGNQVFVDLRDREGVTQCVFRPEESPEAAAASHKLRGEDVVQVIGKVAKRLEGTTNDKLGTGEIEIVATRLVVVNKADVLPFQLDKELSNEDIRNLGAELGKVSRQDRRQDLRRVAGERVCSH